MTKCVVLALLRGVCSPGGAHRVLFVNVFHGSQAPKAPQDCSANNLDVTEELLCEGIGFVIPSGG